MIAGSEFAGSNACVHDGLSLLACRKLWLQAASFWQLLGSPNPLQCSKIQQDSNAMSTTEKSLPVMYVWDLRINFKLFLKPLELVLNLMRNLLLILVLPNQDTLEQALCPANEDADTSRGKEAQSWQRVTEQEAAEAAADRTA